MTLRIPPGIIAPDNPMKIMQADLKHLLINVKTFKNISALKRRCVGRLGPDQGGSSSL